MAGNDNAGHPAELAKRQYISSMLHPGHKQAVVHVLFNYDSYKSHYLSYTLHQRQFWLIKLIAQNVIIWCIIVNVLF